MHSNATTQTTSFPARRGMATLEFVMALPVLLLLMVGLTWLGFSVIGLTEVQVEARNKTWQNRFDDASKRPLYFPILPMYNQKIDYVTKRASKRVRVSPMFDRLPGPEASHTILAGSWDYRAMPFDSPPDFQIMGVAAGIGLFGNALDLGASIDDPLGLADKLKGVRAEGEETRAKNDRNSSTVGEGGDGGSSGSGSGSAPSGETITPDQGKEANEAKQREEKRKLKQRRDELGGQYIYGPNNTTVHPTSGLLRQTYDEIDKLEDQRAAKFNALRNEFEEKKKEQLQKEYDRLDRQVELAELKYKRLEAEFKDVDAELKSLEG